jgi:hypothetical protein
MLPVPLQRSAVREWRVNSRRDLLERDVGAPSNRNVEPNEALKLGLIAAML